MGAGVGVGGPKGPEGYTQFSVIDLNGHEFVDLTVFLFILEVHTIFSLLVP